MFQIGEKKSVPLKNKCLSLQVGESYGSEDCSKEFVCKPDGTFEEKAGAKCHKDATCTVKGQRGCHCKRGLTGDGVIKCESKELIFVF